MKHIKIDSALIGLPSSVSAHIVEFEYDGSNLIALVEANHRLMCTLTFELTDDDLGRPILSGSASIDDAEYYLGCDPSGYDLGGWLDIVDMSDELVKSANQFLVDNCEEL